jgi:predicted negative regulator of RcsB-dependent stress response
MSDIEMRNKAILGYLNDAINQLYDIEDHRHDLIKALDHGSPDIKKAIGIVNEMQGHRNFCKLAILQAMNACGDKKSGERAEKLLNWLHEHR